MITTFGAHSKPLFSTFASTKLKREVEKRSFTRQRGAKEAGSEAMIHASQQITTQKPDFDASSADAAKALYSLSRDVATRRLKTERPEICSLSLDKRSDSSNAFFFSLAQGAQKLAQSESGSPGAAEASLLYELGVNELVQSVADA